MVLSKSIRRIEAYAFNNCHAKVNYPKGLEYIGDHAFDWPKGNILLPDTVKYIGNYAFANCDEAKRLKIGKNVEYIGEGAFSAVTHSIAKIEGRYAVISNFEPSKNRKVEASL